MARIIFSSLVEEIVGKLAGSVFQDSYGGMQIRTRVSPRNPQSQYQQLRRGEFAYLSAGWRNLTTLQRQSFIDAAGTPGQGFNLYLSANINATLIEEPLITDYVASAVPGTMTVEFQTVSPEEMPIIATGGTTTVPAGTRLLVQVTYPKLPTKIFTNPSQYSPVLSIDEGTDLSTPMDIITQWQNRYGQLPLNRRICLKCNLIKKSNGLRGADSINCTISEEMPQSYISLSRNTTPVATTGTSFEALFTYAMPGGTLVNTGDMLQIVTKFKATGAVTTRNVELNIGGESAGSFDIPSAQTFSAVAHVILTGAANFKLVWRIMGANVAKENTTDQTWSIDPTVSNDVIFYGLSDVAGDITAIFQSIDLIKAP